ncbi:hypothetical protein FACS189430_01790 [Bacteroidia bacterium]|nr:hypothetical protein FACS189430_01790 [Bacteroidia bacterium]
MARKEKIPNEVQKRFARNVRQRKENFRAKRQYYLIVCEGEKTEPNYFNALKQDLPKGVLTAVQIDIKGTGRNTQSLIDEALRLKAHYEDTANHPLDRLWTVFDRDSFNEKDFNAAIMRCKNEKIGCAWSNEAFELWYLLHFELYSNGQNRTDYPKLIEKNVRKNIKQYQYRKNSEDMYALLKPKMKDAIRHAKQLDKMYGTREDFAAHNPRTTVYQLVQELLKISNQ